MRPAAALVLVRLICPLTLLLLVAGSSVASGALSQPGLVAAYSFDAGSGSTLTDVSGRGNTGAIAGATWTAAGKSGGALSFDGDDDWVSIADAAALDLAYGMTMEAWVKPSALGGKQLAVDTWCSPAGIFRFHSPNEKANLCADLGLARWPGLPTPKQTEASTVPGPLLFRV